MGQHLFIDTNKRGEVFTSALTRLQENGLIKMHKRPADTQRIEITTAGKSKRLFVINQ